MTNRELLIGILKDSLFVDDDGATQESVINYHINCPYMSSDERCLCDIRGQEPSRELCVECKEKWLEQEVDE